MYWRRYKSDIKGMSRESHLVIFGMFHFHKTNVGVETPQRRYHVILQSVDQWKHKTIILSRKYTARNHFVGSDLLQSLFVVVFPLRHAILFRIFQPFHNLFLEKINLLLANIHFFSWLYIINVAVFIPQLIIIGNGSKFLAKTIMMSDNWRSPKYHLAYELMKSFCIDYSWHYDASVTSETNVSQMATEIDPDLFL